MQNKENTENAEQIIHITDVGKVVGKAVILSKSKDIIFIYIVIGSLCIDNHFFKELCTEREQSNWCSLESAVFHFIKDSDMISLLISDVQESLRSIEKDGIDTQK